MLTELFDRVTKAATERLRPEFFALPGDRPGRKLLLKPDATTEWVEPEPLDRVLTANSLGSLLEIAAEAFDADAYTNPMMTYGIGWAELILDHKTGRERVRWTAGPTREHTFFERAFGSGGSHLSVADAVVAFDTFLSQTVTDTAFVKRVGRLKVVSEQTTEAHHDRSSSLTGGLTKRAADDTEPLPVGTVAFSLLRFAGVDKFPRVPLQCYLRADLDARQWWLCPIEESWLGYTAACLDLIGSRVVDAVADKMPVFGGAYDHVTTERLAPLTADGKDPD